MFLSEVDVGELHHLPLAARRDVQHLLAGFGDVQRLAVGLHALDAALLDVFEERLVVHEIAARSTDQDQEAVVPVELLADSQREVRALLEVQACCTQVTHAAALVAAPRLFALVTVLHHRVNRLAALLAMVGIS
jgi:hypothetical protein